jgi:hypothetical protein
MIKVGEWPCGRIIWLLDVLKHDIGEFDEEIFQCVPRPCELIFCILGLKRNDLEEVAYVIF